MSHESSAAEVLVVGGGISGLTTAIALARLGLSPRIIEIQNRWEPVSSGIFLQSNGLRVLGQLGLLDQVRKRGFAVRDAMAVFEVSGTPITHVRYPRLAGEDVPATVGIKRAVLHELLVEAARKLDIPVSLGATVAAIEPDSGEVLVTTTEGTTSAFRLVVGADGIHSGVRRLVFPERPPPTAANFGVWRCFAPRPEDLDEKIMLIGPGRRLGIMPISDDELYLFGITREPAGSRFDPAVWPAETRARFSDFEGRAPELLASGYGFHYAPVEEVPCEPPWHRGRTVLVGDAAHAMTPFMGQGASMAIEDALVLAELVAVPDTDLEATLTEFERRRRRRVQIVQDRSLAAGKAWGSDADTFSFEELASTMQKRVDDFYATLAPPP